MASNAIFYKLVLNVSKSDNDIAFLRLKVLLGNVDDC